MTQTIKPNDLVYVPTHSLKVLSAKLDTHSTLYATDSENVLVHFYPTGLGFRFEDDSNPERPIVWLATPENKAKIEQFYGCQLEDIPVDKEVELFKEMLDIALYETEKGNFNKEKHFDELVQLFKERGSKCD